MIRITDRISIDESELEERFVRASGPGGQNVNKLATRRAAALRRAPIALAGADTRARLEQLAGRRLTRDGVLVIMAQRHRTQERNRQDARDRLIELIARASVAPTPRRPTRPTRGSKERRLATKKNRSGIKSLRQEKPSWE